MNLHLSIGGRLPQFSKKTEINKATRRNLEGYKTIMKILFGLIILGFSLDYALSTIVEIKKLHNTPNLEFDNMGVTRTYHKKWRTLYTYDLQELRGIEKLVNQAIVELPNSVDPVINQTYRLLHERFNRDINEKWRMLYSIGITLPNRSKHVKRGWLNPIGDLANVLFGTLSQKDAEYYDSELDKLYTDSKSLAVHLDKETTIVKGIVKDFSNYRDRIQSFINVTTEAIYQVIDKIEQRQIQLSTATLLSELVTEYGELTHKLRSLINNGIQGKLDPTLLNDYTQNAMK
ncbi:uncharacterized protein LOC143363198 [Halictus rubicundus]|uniref:uncharacterized protein LOC143363198 n=1 Tax=Halictus rubicundus TaxID=77578 RepID=UPI0040350E08